MTVLVPTMGALHKGHQALIRRARELSKEVIVSIFINPFQFEDKSDLEKYPRSPEKDITLATLAGATEIWMPEYEEIYPVGFTKLSAGLVGGIFEGKARSGHFDSVVTVVNRLFEITKPKFAVFGEKDFQQLFAIQQMKKTVEIISVPTVRNQDGLALSSRNTRLTEFERVSAGVIYRALLGANDGQSSMDLVLATEPSFEVDYAAIIDEKDFSIAAESTRNKRAIIAGWINGVRLIDNMAMKVTR